MTASDGMLRTSRVERIRQWGLQLSRLAPFLRAPGKLLYQRFLSGFARRLREAGSSPGAWLKAYFAEHAPVTFVQVGAFDGVANDPIHELIVNRPRWRGLLIEPIPRAFERLKENYAAYQHKLQFLNVAISDRTCDLSMYEVDAKGLALPNWAPQIASLNRSHITKHFADVDVRELTVPAIRLGEALASAGLDAVDLLVMDVEGHERQILEDFDFDAFRVRVVLFERAHLEKDDESDITQTLEAHGFRCLSFADDTIAYRPMREASLRFKTRRNGTAARSTGVARK
ncbi:MAG TPA: FkbM family methyltransferase [Caulobacteraceae bacterium]